MTRSKRRRRRGRGAESAQSGRLFGAMKKIIAWRPQRAAAQSRKRRRRKKFPARRFRPSSRRRRRTRRRRIIITFIICASSSDHQKAPPLLLLRSRRDRAGRRRRFSSSNSGASVYPHKLRRDVYARQLAHFFLSFNSVAAAAACARACASLRFAPRAGQMLSVSLSRSDLLFSSEDACV